MLDRYGNHYQLSKYRDNYNFSIFEKIHSILCPKCYKSLDDDFQCLSCDTVSLYESEVNHA